MDKVIRNISLARLKMAIQGTHSIKVVDFIEKACNNMPQHMSEIILLRVLRGDSFDKISCYLKSKGYTYAAKKFNEMYMMECEQTRQDDLFIKYFELDRLDTIYEAQSDEVTTQVGVTEEGNSSFQQETTTFLDNQDVNILDLSNEPDPTRMREDQQKITNIANFLSRPRVVGRFSWTPNGNFANANNAITIDPWSTYLQNSITFKLNNFRNFRCKAMHLQFRVNGSPFHYGRLYVSYMPGPRAIVPYATMTIPGDNTVPITNFAGSLNTNARGLKTHWSQYPGVFIDPSTNNVAELVLPFFCPTNYVSLVANSQVASLGKFTIWLLNTLQCVNNTNTEDITVTATAWLEDPILAVPTDQLAYSGEAYFAQAKAGSGIRQQKPQRTYNQRSQDAARMKVGQMKAEVDRKQALTKKKSSNNAGGNETQGKDEYGKGLISAPATALAGFAGTLEKVPVIGPYATATKMVLGKVSSIAKIFGFSRPLVVESPCYVNQRPWSALAVTQGDDTSLKLTLDPKQEITIDPTVVGLPSNDEMSFANIFKRESLLLIASWSQATGATTNLFNILVKPDARPMNLTGDPINFHTALSWGVQPFRYWRGTINYRIQIVASQMHRGRLAIVYNPTRNISASLPDQATTYQQYIDLTECRDYTFSVRYTNPNPWQLLHSPSTQVVTIGTGFGAVEANYSNGSISCYVLNELATPTSTAAPVDINIFISAGDDFMVAVPGSPDFDHVSPFAQVIKDAYGGEAFFGEADYAVDAENAPTTVENMHIVLNADEDDVPNVDNENLVFFGEQNVSLRSLIKRYCLYRRYDFSRSTGGTALGFGLLHPHIPVWPGNADAITVLGQFNWAIGDSDDNGLFNYVRNTLLTYYRIGFAAYRGNVRYKYIFDGSITSGVSFSNVHVTRDSDPTSDTAGSMFSTIVTTAMAGVAASNNLKQSIMYTDTNTFGTFSGTEIESTRLKNGIEFEHPYYANQRFTFTTIDATGSIIVAPSDLTILQKQSIRRSCHRTSFTVIQNALSAHDNAGSCDVYVAAGEDFNLHYFVAAPVLGFAHPVIA